MDEVRVGDIEVQKIGKFTYWLVFNKEGEVIKCKDLIQAKLLSNQFKILDKLDKLESQDWEGRNRTFTFLHDKKK